MSELINDFKDELVYKGYEFKDGIYYVYCETKSKTFKHPKKNIITKKVKSRYYKTIDDMPFNDKPVKLVVKVKIYAFYDLENEKKYFTENLSFLSENYEKLQRTKRLEQFILDTAATTSSNAAEKILKRHGVEISDTSINRMILKKKNQKIQVK